MVFSNLNNMQFPQPYPDSPLGGKQEKSFQALKPLASAVVTGTPSCVVPLRSIVPVRLDSEPQC